MTSVLNTLIEFGKNILKDTDYANDQRWIDGAKLFYEDNYLQIEDKFQNNNNEQLERVSKIMLAQFKYIDSDEFWIFFSHYNLRKELTSFENKLLQICNEKKTGTNISDLKQELDLIINKFNYDYIEQEQEWLNNAIKEIVTLLKNLN